MTVFMNCKIHHNKVNLVLKRRKNSLFEKTILKTHKLIEQRQQLFFELYFQGAISK